MIDIFKKDGYLNGMVPNYEYREEQLLMADFILERLVEKEHAIVEAGTGTGKTLAYLLPAIIHAKKNDLRVAITTETKALQKQLLTHDLPLVQKLLTEKFGIEFNYALCMGSVNYVCRKRCELVISKGLFSQYTLDQLDQIRKLIVLGEVFTRFDVSVSDDVWRDVCREPDACLSYRCHYRQQCTFMRAKKEWENADLLIMNHYMFFTNIASGQTYLPPSDIIIFDEAHSLEDIASNQLGFDISFSLLRSIMDRFHTPRRRNTLLTSINNKLHKENAIQLWEEIIKEGDLFFTRTGKLLTNKSQWQRILKPIEGRIELITRITELLSIFEEIKDDFDDESLQIDFDIARSKLFIFCESLKSFTEQNQRDYVYWLEPKNNGTLLSELHCKGQPLRINNIMRAEVMRRYNSAIFVSATLSINKDFSYTAGRLGIERFKTMTLPSPFDYKQQAVLFLEKNMPEPTDPSFTLSAAKLASNLIQLVNGNCLLLFTSYKMLEEVRSLIANMIPHRIYSQGDLPSQEALAMYINDENSVLMGTHSFWQGIDLPGDLLRCVIMMRLPFAVPDSPIIQARSDELKEKGKNPFVVYQIPEAVIKFKQGFGRLIRSKKDHGIIAVLDTRITSKPYGSNFLQSVPACRQVFSFPVLSENYAQFFENACK